MNLPLVFGDERIKLYCSDVFLIYFLFFVKRDKTFIAQMFYELTFVFGDERLKLHCLDVL